MNTIIEKYIKFAINNNLIENISLKNYDKIIELNVGPKNTHICVLEKPGHTMSETFNNIELITSKPFIDSVLIGLRDKGYSNDDYGTISKIKFLNEQSYAIYDENLDEFITKKLGIK